MLDHAGPRGQGGLRPPAPLPQVRPLGPIALLKALWRNPLEAWTETHFERPVVTTNLAIGQITVVSEPHAIRRVLLENAANYRKDGFQRRMMSATLSNGLLMAENEQWHAQRRTLAPLFSHRTVLGFEPNMLQAADALVARWRGNPQDAVVEVTAEVTRLTLDVLERTIFSDGLGRGSEEVRTAMRSYFDNIGRIEPFDILGLPDSIPRLSRWRLRPVLRLFDSAVDAIIETRRRHIEDDPASVPRDLLTLLLEAEDPKTGAGMSEAEIRANIVTFIAAGHETTANTIAWSLFLLSQSPEWCDWVRAEAISALDGPVVGLAERLPTTLAVIEEAIRLYPPLPAISRAAIGPDELAGHKIKAGSMVVIAPYLLHRHRMLWERPDIFDPNRFLGSARSAIPRYTYLPFGAGPRICIGSAFALQEATVVVAAIVRNFDFELAPGRAVWPVLKVTLRPQGGLFMHLRPRSR
jgi:cytochrome P450